MALLQIVTLLQILLLVYFSFLRMLTFTASPKNELPKFCKRKFAIVLLSLKTNYFFITLFAEKSISRIAILYIVAILFVIFNISDIRIGGLSKLIPLFDLMIIFYFAVFRRVFGLCFIFLLGIWSDALNGNPLGLTSICYIFLVKFFITLNQRLVIRENFKQLWQQFIFFCGCFLFLKWMILSIFNEAFYSISSILAQFILTILFYVLMHKFFDYLYQKLVEEK